MIDAKSGRTEPGQADSDALRALGIGCSARRLRHDDHGPTDLRRARRRVGVSLRLLVIGAVLGTVIGVVVGAWGAIRQYHLIDRVITVLSLLLLSTPVFVIANLLILGALRVNSVLGVQLFEYIGETSPDAVGGGWNQFVDRVQHLVLPTFTLALMAIAGYSRYQRNAMLDVLGQDFIRTARAKGLTRRQALFKHGLRTALIPMATLFAYGISGLVTGAVFTEKIFGWHGMGEWVVQGIATQDTNIIAAVTVFTGAAVLLAGLLSDVIYAALDPEGASRHDRTGHHRKRDGGQVRVWTPHEFASRRTLVWRRFLRNKTGRRGPGAARAVLRRLLRASAAAAVQLHRSGLLRAAAAAQHRPLVRHQRTRPGPARADAARHAEVDADRRLCRPHRDDSSPRRSVRSPGISAAGAIVA